VPIVLDRHSTQYSQWRGLFLNTLGKYALVDHVNLDAAPQDVGDWDTMECIVRSWMYASITPDLLSDVMTPGASVHHVWLTIEDQFIGNKETRALILDTEFRNFVQGDLPVADYCRKLKSMADSLCDLGEPVLDRTLVLSVLHGLNEEFGYMGAILKRQKSFPSFSEVKNDLLVEEISMAKPAAPSQALIATAPRPPVGLVPGGPSSSKLTCLQSRAQEEKQKQKEQHSGLAFALQSVDWAYPDVARGTAWATFWFSPPSFQSQQHWGPTPPFQQGPSPPQQAFLDGPVGPAFASPGGMLPGLPGLLPTPAGASFGLCAPLPGMPTPPLWMPPQAAPPLGLLQAPPGAVWDHNDLAHNFNMMTLTPPPNTEWYMDYGASSHMASNSGILSHVFSPNYSTPTSIVVGNGSLLPVTSTGHTYFPSASRPLYLYDVLVSHDIIKNLISVRRFTTDNLVSVEFDPFGLSVKDLQTRNVIVRCNSSGQLYPLFP
jgi:hypothetical protein